MPFEGIASAGSFGVSSVFIIKAFLILFLIFYAVFALMLFRQIQLMNKNMPTSLSPLLKSIAILNLGVSWAVLFLVVGSF